MLIVPESKGTLNGAPFLISVRMPAFPVLQDNLE